MGVFIPRKRRARKMAHKDSSYPVAGVLEVTVGFGTSFQDRLMLLSPINEGAFECSA